MHKGDRVRLSFDPENMMETTLGGGQGIQEEEISLFEERTCQLHSQLQQAYKTGELGFMDLIYGEELVEEIEDIVEKILPWCENFVVLGIGGSALGNMALFRALRPPFYNLFAPLRGGRPRLFITNNIDPEEWKILLKNLHLKKTIFNVISKSGSTAETMALYFITQQLMQEEVGDDWPSHFIFTTSKTKGELYGIKEEKGITTLPIPENVGGRFSVFSSVGLLSSAVVGIDIGEVLKGAQEMDAWCSTDVLWDNPAYLKAVLSYLAVKKGKNISIMMPYAYSLEHVADWYLQLAGESLGKRFNRDKEEVFTGYTPVKAMGVTDQHSQLQLYMEGPFDKVITFLEVERFKEDLKIPEIWGGGVSYLGGHQLSHLFITEKKGTQMALTEGGRMNATIKLPYVGEYTLGQLLYMLQLEVAFAGELYHINAFHQPGVELGKKITRQILSQ